MSAKFLKRTFRHLFKQGGFTGTNIIGLTVGLTACILIGLFVADELSFDTFHSRADRIVRVTWEFSTGGTVNHFATTGTKVGPQFKRSFPAVENFTRTVIYPAIINHGTDYFNEKKVLYVDSSFFSIFSFPLLEGDPNSLKSTGNIIVTASAAQKYFGTTDVIGKALRVGGTKDYTVSAVAKDPPRNSQIQFDFIVSFDNLDAAKSEQWRAANYVTYLLLRNPAAIGPLQSSIDAYVQTPQVRKDAEVEGNDYIRYHLESLTRVHLHSPYSPYFAIEPNGNITYVYVLVLIALLILVIACVNYTNLAIAQSSARTGEIGIRKVLGASRSQLFSQYAGESVFVTFIALTLSIGVAIILLPLFNDMTGKHLIAADLAQIRPLAVILGTGLIIGLFAGAYPAIVLANTRLVNILRSGFRITGGQASLRRTLIVLQFVISLFLIITTAVILQQMSYIRNRSLGLDRDHVVVLPLDDNMLNRYDGLKTAIMANPGVIGVSGSYNLPISPTWNDGLTAMTNQGKVNFPITVIPADLGYLATMKMQVLAGSDFTQADLPVNTNAKDSTKPVKHVILNETAVRKLGWTRQEAIGKMIATYEPAIVKGVVRDFNFASIHESMGPLMLLCDPKLVRNMVVRVSGKQLPATIERIHAVWKTYVPNRPFEYHFLDEDYNRLYATEQRTARLFTLFASLAILLACLGLFGLAAISTVQRTKEIGIRKVLGAGVLNICLLVSNSFLRFVGLAILIAAPLAWWAAGHWLDSFAYRIAVGVWIFPAAGASAALLAFGTISIHAVRAARANPAKSLKTEG
jgi:putative ABC transport system permease protein